MSEVDPVGEKLYTLTEVSNKIDVSMPTLQRYKKLYQDRIPSQGIGRSQRYPEEALEVFLQLKKENMGKRGRPRKNKSGGGVAPRKKDDSKAGLLTLTQIAQETNISYPTLLRYVKSHLAEIPHRGSGRGRRYLPEAVEVFRTIREQSRRGRKRKGTPTASTGDGGGGTVRRSTIDKLIERIKTLERGQKDLEKAIQRQQKQLEKPLKIVLQR